MYVEPAIGPPEKLTVPPGYVTDPVIVLAVESKVEESVPLTAGLKPKSFAEDDANEFPDVVPVP